MNYFLLERLATEWFPIPIQAFATVFVLHAFNIQFSCGVLLDGH
jgi:hypothetical protein